MVLSDAQELNSFRRQMRQKENHSLSELYMPTDKRTAIDPPNKLRSPTLVEYANRLKDISQSFEHNAHAVQAVTLQEVEQEREVAVEAETVRYVSLLLQGCSHFTPTSLTAKCTANIRLTRATQGPPHRVPLEHQAVKGGMRQFCVDGIFGDKNLPFKQALLSIRKTRIGTRYGVFAGATKTPFFVTQDFTDTVELPDTNKDDTYLRPVTWLLLSINEGICVIISPWEAEQLLPILRNAQEPKVHLVTYSAPVTQGMLCFDTCNFFAVPSLPTGWTAPQWLRRDLGIFAGRLYFPFEDYHELCDYLGVEKYFDTTLAQEGDMDETDDTTAKGQLTSKPKEFLQEWLAMRRKGQDFLHTPMGFIVQGKGLTSSHAFFKDTCNSKTE